MPTRDWKMSYPVLPAGKLLQYLTRNHKSLGSGGSMVARLKLKGIDGRAPPEWSLRLNLTQHGKTHQVQTQLGLTDWELFLDSVGGGAWPFLVGGVICLVNSDNERDLSLLISDANDYIRKERVLVRALGLTWWFYKKTCFHLLEFWYFGWRVR